MQVVELAVARYQIIAVDRGRQALGHALQIQCVGTAAGHVRVVRAVHPHCPCVPGDHINVGQQKLGSQPAHRRSDGLGLRRRQCHVRHAPVHLVRRGNRQVRSIDQRAGQRVAALAAVHDQPVVAGGAIDGHQALDAVQGMDRRDFQGKRIGIDGDSWRGDLARRRPHLASVLHVHGRHVPRELDDRVEDPPAAPGGSPGDGLQRISDQAVQAAGIAYVDISPAVLVVLVPTVDPGRDLGFEVRTHASRADRSPQRLIPPEADTPPEPRSVVLQYIELDERCVLHDERGRLIGEGRRIEEQRRMVASQMDLVVAAATADRDFQVRRRTEHVDLVVAAAAVDFQSLDSAEVRDAAGSGDKFLSDYEGVSDGRPVDDNRVGPRAAKDVDRGILQIDVPVGPAAAEQPRQVTDRGRVVRVVVQHQEGVDDERVVTLLTEQEDFRGVVVDFEQIVLRAAVDVQRCRGAAGHVDDVGNRDARGIVEIRIAPVGNGRDVADRDQIVARTRLDDRLDRRVVGGDDVPAAQCPDREPLDTVEPHVLAVGIRAADQMRELRGHRGVGIARHGRVAVYQSVQLDAPGR